MKLLLWFCIAAASTLTGCALFIPWECLYLKAAQGRATTHEVQQKLGPPSARVDEGAERCGFTKFGKNNRAIVARRLDFGATSIG